MRKELNDQPAVVKFTIYNSAHNGKTKGFSYQTTVPKDVYTTTSI